MYVYVHTCQFQWYESVHKTYIYVQKVREVNCQIQREWCGAVVYVSMVCRMPVAKN